MEPKYIQKFKNTLKNFRKAADYVGNIFARAVFTLFYLILVAPFAVFFALFADRLNIAGKTGSSWHEPKEQSAELDDLRKQS